MGKLEDLPIFNIPWGHNIAIFEGVKSLDERLWYVNMVIQEGWSRNALVDSIKIKGANSNFDLLHALLEQQFYRLAGWHVAGQEINYRRFFNINELIVIHIEKEKVLNAHHEMVFKLIEEGKVQGLRIDHPDGLYDPATYFERIQAHHPSFVVLEKILNEKEPLPSFFQVQGTVGYEFLNLVNGLFIQADNAAHFSKIYDNFIGHETDFTLLLYERKKQFMKLHMGSEILAMGWALAQITETSRYYRDFTRRDLTKALGEIICCFPVYRTYIRKGEEVSKRERDYIIQAVEAAAGKTPEIDPSIYAFIRALLLTELKDSMPETMDFIFRFQQQTAPVMAKGLEDSAFYIFNRFISLNEVGGDPKCFGLSKSEFHQFNSEKLSKWPLGFLPSTTQDTKRSEDVRMRLNVLSEIPKKWGAHVALWEKENRKYKKKLRGALFPDRNAEYFLYQTLVGIWPDDPSEANSASFLERIWGYILKSLREAGIYTSWLRPSEEYEMCMKEFLSALLLPHGENLFYPSFVAFQKEIAHYGRLNSLSSLILRIGSCGIVDLYRGNEWWDYSLADPDNRRPVDYSFLKKSLDSTSCRDKTLKLWVTAAALRFRRENKEIFLEGQYIPLVVQKSYKENCVAFLRKRGAIRNCGWRPFFHTDNGILGRDRDFTSQNPRDKGGKGCFYQ